MERYYRTCLSASPRGVIDSKVSLSADITNRQDLVDGETIAKWPAAGRSTIRRFSVPSVMARW